MTKQQPHSWFWQIVLFLVLSLLFSALPFLFALLLDKSSLLLAVFMAWYAIFPPVILLIIAWFLYHNERTWAVVSGRLAVGVGIWFGLQLLLSSLVTLHIFVRLFALPYTLAGGKGYILGALVFLVGGLALWIGGLFWGGERSATGSSHALTPGATTYLALALLAPILLIALTNRSAATPTGEQQSPTRDEVFGYIQDVYNIGIRRPGWPAAQQAKDYLVSQLASFGFDDVNVEPFTFDLWKENAWSLTIGPSSDSWQPETYFYPYTGPTLPEGVEAELVYVSEPSEESFSAADVEGKIVVINLPPTNISWDQMKIFTFLAFDPDQTAAGWAHPYPIGWPVLEAYDLAVQHGAVGLVSILSEYPEIGKFAAYLPYDGEIRPLPSLYVRDEDGQRLRDQIKAGAARANLVLDANVSPGGGDAWTVYGVLPGQRDDIVMVHTHYDAPWQSGVEDSSGVGMVLGLARYFAQVPREQRPYTMVFFFGGGHMIGARGNTVFMKAHKEDIMDKLVIDVAIEHIADDFNPPNPYTGMVEPRGNFIFENPVLVSTFARAVASHNTYRLLLFPTGTPLGVPTDAGMFARDGYPVSSLISGPVGLFDDDDTLERVAVDELAPLSAMYIDFIGRIGKVPSLLLGFNLNELAVVFTTAVLILLAALRASR